MADEDKKKTKKSCCTRLRDWVGSASFYIYLNFFLGAWGDRMWSFSVGLFLVVLSKGLLRLAAIYGLCNGISVLLFGGLLGDWVDRNARLKVIRISLFIQNFSVMLSAIAVCLTLHFEDQIDTYWDGGLKMLCEACIVTFAVIAQLASVAYKISLQKDWIVEVAGGKKSTLANLNAVMRALDLSCKVLAPTSTGVIMSAASLVVSAIVIAGWNLVSVFVEYALLMKVYNMVPSLGNKKRSSDQKQPDNKETNNEKEHLADTDKEEYPESKKEEPTEEVSLKEEESLKESGRDNEKPEETDDMVPKPKKKKKTPVELIFDPFISVFRSWRIYVKQKAVFAGLSLSFLYMTVLGFDSITVGFIYTNGVTELLAGISMAFAGATGILGTFIFTRLRPRIGLERTGLFAYFFEVVFLSLCVMSIWAPGSPFDPFYKPAQACKHEQHKQISVSAVTTVLPSTLDISNISPNEGNATHNIGKRDVAYILNKNFPSQEYTVGNTVYSNLQGFTFMDVGSPNTQNVMPSSYSIFSINKSQIMAAENSKIEAQLSLDSLDGPKQRHKKSHVILKRDLGLPSNQSDNANNTSQEDCVQKWKHDGLSISVILLLIGIVTSRVGLWMADLTVTQILQESVPENERGAVGGVQSSLNMFFDLLKFIVVIFVPHIETFGYLIIMSYTFICCAGLFFSFHSYRVRGHLFHCRAFWCFCCDKNSEKPLENGKKPTLEVTEKDVELGNEMKNTIKSNKSQGDAVV